MSNARRNEPSVPATQPSLIYLIGRVNQGITREMRSRLDPWDLSVPEFTALSVLANRPGLSNAQLARRTMITPQSMIQILAKLERRELVRRELDPNHQRILRAKLTSTGREILANANVAIDAIHAQMLDGVSEIEQQMIRTVLLRAARVLSESDRRGVSSSDSAERFPEP
jgi:DNA-binding MarR family transcriptional regulator